jgi:hypothetical protein
MVVKRREERGEADCDFSRLGWPVARCVAKRKGSWADEAEWASGL